MHLPLQPWPLSTPDPARTWPRVSVVVPNFNYAATLERTLLSILMQGYPNLELIVVDGGSDDGSGGIIERYSPCIAWWGDLCCWVNSDDVHFPWTLRLVAEIFNAVPQAQWIMGTPSLLVDACPRFQYCESRVYPQHFIRCGLFHQEPFGWVQQESCFWRRSLWDAVGGLDTTYQLAADFDLWMRFARLQPLYSARAALSGFMSWGGNRSVLHRAAYEQEIERIVERMPAEDRRLRQQLLRRVARLPRLARLLGPRPARRLLGLHSAGGPFVAWEWTTQAYQLRQPKFFQ